MGSPALNTLAKEFGPEAALVSAITAPLASSAAVDLSAAVGRWVRFGVLENDVHVVFGVTGLGAATVNDLAWPAGTLTDPIFIDAPHAFIRAIRSTASAADGIITVAVVAR